ncbi:MAG: hypothetical protein ABIZ56_12250, partial [Chthoniobacteraceae bacterium]
MKLRVAREAYESPALIEPSRKPRTNITTAQDRAIDSANDNTCDGQPIVLTTSDIEFGLWDTPTETFTLLSGPERQSATAMRITAMRVESRNNAITTPLAGVIGRPTTDVKAVAIALVGKDKDFNIPGTSCPWLAGMPSGTTISGQGSGVRSPDHSPVLVSGVPLTPGQRINFRNTTGQTGDTTTGRTYGLDGDLTRTNIRQVPANGINSTTAPLNCLVGIFLDDRAPNTYAMPSELNFSTAAARDFDSISPQLKQVFFIGDGVNSNNRLQDFIMPPGATSLYLGVMDENAFWWDNVGSIGTTLYDGKVT